MKKIYKYPIIAGDVFRHKLPKDAEIIKVDVQEKGGPCMWAIFDSPEGEFEIREFAVVPTGKPFYAIGWKYLGTFLPAPDLVFHLFDTGTRY